MKKISLQQTIEDPFDIFGILSPLKSFVLAHHLNQLHGYDLVRHPHDLHYELKNTGSHHAIFSYTIADNLNHVYLVSNKGQLPLLVERKELDYLLIMKGEQRISNLELYTQIIRSIKGVQYINYINSSGLKSLQNHPLCYLP